MHINQVQNTLAPKKKSQNKVGKKMLIAIQQINSNIIGTQKHISRGGLESHFAAFLSRDHAGFFSPYEGHMLCTT